MSYAIRLPLAAGTVKDGEMTAKPEPKVALPTWVLPIILTLLLTIVGNIVTSVWWASQMTVNQQHMIDRVAELRADVQRLSTENQRLREDVAAIKAGQRPVRSSRDRE